MNENYKTIVENNKEFFDLIKELIKESLKDKEVKENYFKIENKFYEIINIKNMDSLIRKVIAYKEEEVNLLIIKDNLDFDWVFSVGKEIKFDSVYTYFLGKQLTLTHNAEESKIYSLTSKMNKLYVVLNKSDTKEMLELTNIKYDIDISNILKFKIEDFIFADSKNKNKISNKNKL